MPNTHRLQPGEKVNLADFPTTADEFCDNRKDAEKEFKKLRKELVELQNCFYADGSKKLLVVFQAMDAGGKDGTIRKVFQGVNPQGVEVTSFKKPSSKELAHDYLWRIHQAVPGAGMIGVFNRSHYEDVLVVRVHNYVPKSVWEPRFEQINDFERLLSTSGTTVLKFYLHISKEEQKQRFQDRLDNPDKHWKFSADDLEKRKLWDDYMAAFEDVLGRCTTEYAPWYVIPADQKWYRNLAISKVLVDTLKNLDPQFPPPEDNIDGIVIE